MMHLHWYEYLILFTLILNAFFLGMIHQEGLSFRDREEKIVSFVAIVVGLTVGGWWYLIQYIVQWSKDFGNWFMAITQLMFWWQWHFTRIWETIDDERMDSIALRISMLMKEKKRTLIQRHHLHCCMMIRNRHLGKFKQRANEI